MGLLQEKLYLMEVMIIRQYQLIEEYVNIEWDVCVLVLYDLFGIN